MPRAVRPEVAPPSGVQMGANYRTVQGQHGRPVRRRVVKTLEECVARRGDYFDERYGWLRSGGKKESDDPDVPSVVFNDDGTVTYPDEEA